MLNIIGMVEELDRLRSLGLLSSDPLERLKAAVREARIKRPDEDIRG